MGLWCWYVCSLVTGMVSLEPVFTLAPMDRPRVFIVLGLDQGSGRWDWLRYPVNFLFSFSHPVAGAVLTCCFAPVTGLMWVWGSPLCETGVGGRGKQSKIMQGLIMKERVFNFFTYCLNIVIIFVFQNWNKNLTFIISRLFAHDNTCSRGKIAKILHIFNNLGIFIYSAYWWFSPHGRMFYLYDGGQHHGGRKLNSAWGKPITVCWKTQLFFSFILTFLNLLQYWKYIYS